MLEIVARISFEARASDDVSQASGVSVRTSLNNYETLLANAEKRVVRTGEREIVPRPSDLHAVIASTGGKIELDYGGEENVTAVVERLVRRAVLATWDAHVGGATTLAPVVEHFEAGWGVEVSDHMPAEEYREGIERIPGLREAVDRLGPMESPGLMAAAVEFVLEGLHLHQRLNKDVEGGRARYHA
jgi:magnesium chelatase subunit I